MLRSRMLDYCGLPWRLTARDRALNRTTEGPDSTVHPGRYVPRNSPVSAPHHTAQTLSPNSSHPKQAPPSFL